MDYSKTYQNYYLNLSNLSNKQKEKEFIQDLYRDSLIHFSQSEDKIGNSMFKKLIANEYVLNFDKINS